MNSHINNSEQLHGADLLKELRISELFPKNYLEVEEWLDKMVGNANWNIRRVKAHKPHSKSQLIVVMNDPYIEVMFYIKFGHTMVRSGQKIQWG